MVDFSACSCREGIEAVYVLLSKLGHQEPKGSPFSLLGTYMDALNRGELLLAAKCYHSLSDSLLNAPARRVSGSLWLDYLLYLTVELEHPFAVAAAMKKRDEHLFNAMRHKLTVFYELSTLDDAALIRFALERHRELKLKPRGARDHAELMSSALWSGAPPKALEKTDEKPAVLPPLSMDFTWAAWHYGEVGLNDSYVSDEALEEIYMRLLSGRPWDGLINDLWNFFASYGCGMFLKSRAFTYEDERLAPLPEGVLAEAPSGRLYEEQRRALLENTIRFMQDERAFNMALEGPSGTGKTTEVLSLPSELPEVRLIAVNGATPIRPGPLFALLSAQPLKFVVLLDDMDFASPAAKALLVSLLGLRAQPSNVLLYATTQSALGGETAFQRCIRFPYPQLKEFTELVTELLALENVHAPYDMVRNVCIDYQVDAHEKLTFPAAMRVAQSVRRELFEG